MTHLREKHGDRVAAFATGTPVSNSIAEMYIMQLYLQPGVLSEYDILEFDAWAGTFADIVTEVELAPSGQGFRTTRSFSKFVNIPELIGLYSRVADTQTAEMLNLPRPKPEIVVVETEMSARETAIMEQLVRRAEAIKGKRPEKGADNILKIMGEGLRLALDIRLLDPSAPINPHGTVIAAVANITQIYREGQYPGLCQIAFCDAGTPGSKAGLKPAVRDATGITMMTAKRISIPRFMTAGRSTSMRTSGPGSLKTAFPARKSLSSTTPTTTSKRRGFSRPSARERCASSLARPPRWALAPTFSAF